MAAVAALVQTVAGGVEHHLDGIFAQRKAQLVFGAGFGQRAGMVAVHQPLDDRLFDDALAGGHAGQLAGKAGALDREGRVGGEEFLPRDGVDAVKQFVEGRGLPGFEQQQHALGRAQVEVGGGDERRRAGELHAAVRNLYVFGAEAAHLKGEGGFGAEKAGRHKSIRSRHEGSFRSIENSKKQKRRHGTRRAAHRPPALPCICRFCGGPQWADPGADAPGTFFFRLVQRRREYPPRWFSVTRLRSAIFSSLWLL